MNARPTVLLLLMLSACGNVGDSGANESACASPSAETFEECFTETWCQAWEACGFSEDCVDLRPLTTHYESGDGTVDIDCEPISDPSYEACVGLPEAASCDDLELAAQRSADNGPWIDTCAVTSCV